MIKKILSTSYIYIILLSIITIGGLFVRLYGIDFGKPYLYHIDEWKLVNQAGHFLDIKNIDQSTFFNIGTYPPFFIYMLAISFGIYSAIGLLLGIFPSISSIIDMYKSNPFTFHLIGRYISAILGSATIVFTYLIGSKIFNKKVGLMGALFLAFTFVHVRNSHYCTVDISATFFVVVTFWFITSIYNKGDLKYYIGAGIFSAISVATKYTVGLILIPFFVAHFLRSGVERYSIKQSILSKKLLIGIISFGLVFLIVCPFPILNIYLFYKDTSQIASTVTGGRIGYFTGDGFFSYITGAQWSGFGHFARNSLAGGMGLHTMIFAIGGFLLCSFKFSKKCLLFLSLPVIHFIVLSSMSYKAMRLMLPIIPFLILLCGWFIFYIIQKIPLFKERQNIMVIGFSLICVLPMMIDSIRNDYKLTLKETRTIAKEWIESNIPSGTKIAIESKSPQLYNINPNFTIMGPRLVDEKDSSKSYFLVDSGWFLFSYAPDEYVNFDPIEEINKNNVDYVILDNWTYDRFYMDEAISKYPIKTNQRRKFYDWVRNNAQFIKKFEPVPNHITGPTIEIFKIRH
ncbi:MAG: ArnT family glycosyltransferase [Methanosarcinales archaeon]